MIELFLEKKEFFFDLLLEHIKISAVSILIAIMIGLFIGILISEYKKTSKLTLSVISFLYTIPSISMLGFLIPFTGVGNTTAIIVLTIYALLPMVRNTYTGLTNVDENILEAAKGMGSTDFQILYKIKLPLSMPMILSGIRSMATMTIALAGIASFIGAGGLGVAIYRGITTNNTNMTMIGSILIALLALFVDFILGCLEKKKRFNKKGSILVVILIILSLFVSLFLNKQQETIHIATKPMTEQYILGEMMDILIEQDTNLNVEITQGVGGGTSNIQPGMESAEFDIYPEYTGTGWNMVLKKDGLYTEDLFEDLQKQYQKKYDMSWIGMYGFNDTYGLVVRKEIAEQYGLKTYSDLKNVSSQLVFGAEYDFFEREDGYDALCAAYGLNFKKTMDLDIGLKYQAINQGKIDVMNVFTTDGQLSTSNVTVLKDDQNLYPSYMCGNVVRNEVLKQHPELKMVLNKLTNTISDAQMAKMNYEVETLKKEPRDIAKKFLKDRGLLK